MTARAPLPADTIRPKHLRPVPQEQEDPLRAGSRPRNLSEARTGARNIELPILQRALKAISNQQISDALGATGDRVGALIRNGAAPLTSGELALLLPSLPAVGRCFMELLELRVQREIDSSGLRSNDPILTNLRLAQTHIAALRVLLGATE